MGDAWLTQSRVWWLVAALGFGVNALASTNSVLSDLQIPLWDQEVTLKSGFGYKDNVSLSASDPHGSAFYRVAADGLVFRLPTQGWFFNLFASVENVGYLERDTGVDNEQFAVAAMQLTREFSEGWRVGGGLNYMFQNQVLDMSTQETNNYTIGAVRGHTVGERLFGRKKLEPYWVEAEVGLVRQWLAAPMDNSWQLSPRLSLGRNLGPCADLALNYHWTDIWFDSRETVDESGATVSGSHLRFGIHTVELAWHRFWDAKKRWDSASKLGAEFNQDNGSGYFDYRQFHFGQQIRYRLDPWEISAQVRLSYYGFPQQQISDTDPGQRQKVLMLLGLHADRRVWKQLRAFADYSLDCSLSDTGNDRYQANTFTAGLEWQF